MIQACTGTIMYYVTYLGLSGRYCSDEAIQVSRERMCVSQRRDELTCEREREREEGGSLESGRQG
jgi:hypothetical protein